MIDFGSQIRCPIALPRLTGKIMKINKKKDLPGIATGVQDAV